MMHYVISGLLILFAYMVGCAQRSESDKMRIFNLNKEIHDQMLTILKHEKTIETLKWLAKERKKEEVEG